MSLSHINYRLVTPNPVFDEWPSLELNKDQESHPSNYDPSLSILWQKFLFNMKAPNEVGSSDRKKLNYSTYDAPPDFMPHQKKSTYRISQKQHKSPPTEFRCPIIKCKLKFEKKGSLRNHFKKKHPQLMDQYTAVIGTGHDKSKKNYPCPLNTCKSGYSHHRDLKAHLSAKHPELINGF